MISGLCAPRRSTGCQPRRSARSRTVAAGQFPKLQSGPDENQNEEPAASLPNGHLLPGQAGHEEESKPNSRVRAVSDIT